MEHVINFIIESLTLSGLYNPIEGSLIHIMCIYFPVRWIVNFAACFINSSINITAKRVCILIADFILIMCISLMPMILRGGFEGAGYDTGYIAGAFPYIMLFDFFLIGFSVIKEYTIYKAIISFCTKKDNSK